LRLHQTEDFGAKIIAAIRPPQPAPGDRTEAAMDTFDKRARHKYFAVGLRVWQIVNFAAGNLERYEGLRLTRLIGLEEICALNGDNQL